MSFAVTGGTGFIGARLVGRLARAGHSVEVLARGRTHPPASIVAEDRVTVHASDLGSVDRVAAIIDGCDAVAHLAGINHERGQQTYARVHRQATDTVVRAVERAAVDRLVLSSYLRARPDVSSGYLTSKWAAEERVRDAAVPACILKPAGVFGPGDQFLTGLARWIRTVPLVPTVGIADRHLRPVAVEDVVRVLDAGLTDDRLGGTTLPLMGPSSVTMRSLARLIGTAVDRQPIVVPAPVASQRIGAAVFERILDPPLVTRAGVRMIAEGMTDPAPPAACDRVPPDLRPDTPLDVTTVERAVGDVHRYGFDDLRRS